MKTDIISSCKEHVDRARLFYTEALDCHYPPVRHRKLIAAVYFCQAIKEIVMDASKCGKIPQSESDLKRGFAEVLPFSELIFRIRIHDFHRDAVVPCQGIVMRGPIAIKTGAKVGSAVCVTLEGGVPVLSARNGNGSLNENKALTMMNGRIHDDASGEYLPLEMIIGRYLTGVDAALDFIESLFVRAGHT